MNRNNQNKKRRKNKSDENRIGNIRIPIGTGEIGKLESPSFDAESLILDANKRKYQPQYENMEDKNIAVGLAVDDDNDFCSKQREEKVKKKKGKKRTNEKNKKETSNILQNRQEEMFSTLTESKFSEEMESTHYESKNIESDDEGCNMEGENDSRDAFAETDENNGKKNSVYWDVKNVKAYETSSSLTSEASEKNASGKPTSVPSEKSSNSGTIMHAFSHDKESIEMHGEMKTFTDETEDKGKENHMKRTKKNKKRKESDRKTEDKFHNEGNSDKIKTEHATMEDEGGKKLYGPSEDQNWDRFHKKRKLRKHKKKKKKLKKTTEDDDRMEATHAINIESEQSEATDSNDIHNENKLSNQTEINTEPTGKENIYSCPQLWEKVLKNYMGLFPLWSGLLLGNLDRFDKEGKQKSSQVNQEKHATNALVENYFGYIKSAIPKGKRLPPAEFLRRQYVDVKGKLAEIEKRHPEVFKYHRRKSIVEEKETWKKRKEKNQSLYFNPLMYLQSPRKKTQADKKSSTAAPQSPTLEATTSQERKRGTHASIAKDPGQIVESSKLQQSEAPTRKRKRITQTLTIDDRGQNVDPSKSQTPEATLIRKRRRVNPSMTAKDQGQNENSSTTQIPATTPTVKKRLTPSETPKYRGKKVEYSKTQPTEAEPILKKKGTPSATSKDPGKNVESLKSQQPVNKQPQKIRVTRSAYAKDPGQNLDSSKSQLSEAKQTKKIRVTSSLNTKDLAGNEESSKTKHQRINQLPKEGELPYQQLQKIQEKMLNLQKPNHQSRQQIPKERELSLHRWQKMEDKRYCLQKVKYQRFQKPEKVRESTLHR